jgi:capsule polysaccharide export protein KpsE/RkpR
MRLPILLALAVIVFTPANIREITFDALGKAQQMVAQLTSKASETTQVADLDSVDLGSAQVLKTRHDTAKNSISNVR